MENLLEHFEIHHLIELPHIFGIDLSISMAVIVMWIAAAVAFLLIYLAGRNPKLVPKGLQNIIEVFVEFMREEIVMNMIGKEGLPFLPFLTSLFFFIVLCGLIGLLPGSFTPTSNPNVTGTLAVIVLLVYPTVGIVKKGFFGYFKGWIPEGVPLGIAVIMWPIELVGNMVLKPFSLAVRLFANMLAGHLVLFSFLGLVLIFKSFIIAPFPVLGALIIFFLELAFAFIQAYIFTVLSAMYIGEAIHHGH